MNALTVKIQFAGLHVSIAPFPEEFTVIQHTQENRPGLPAGEFVQEESITPVVVNKL